MIFQSTDSLLYVYIYTAFDPVCYTRCYYVHLLSLLGTLHIFLCTHIVIFLLFRICIIQYLFRMRKEVTTNYKVLKTDKYHKIQKSNNEVSCLTQLHNTCLMCCGCIVFTSSYNSNFVIQFSEERMEN